MGMHHGDRFAPYADVQQHRDPGGLLHRGHLSQDPDHAPAFQQTSVHGSRQMRTQHPGKNGRSKSLRLRSSACIEVINHQCRCGLQQTAILTGRRQGPADQCSELHRREIPAAVVPDRPLICKRNAEIRVAARVIANDEQVLPAASGVKPPDRFQI